MKELAALQDAEVEALQAIFDADFTRKELPEVWGRAAPVEFLLRIRPEEESLKPQVGVNLHVKFPPLYPRVTPALSLDEPAGLSRSHVDALLETLKQRAKDLIGSEMVYELATLASTRITERNSIVPKQSASLIDERLERAAEEHKQKQAERDALETHRKAQLAREEAILARQIEDDLGRKTERLRKERQKGEALAMAQIHGDSATAAESLPTTFTMTIAKRSLRIQRGAPLHGSHDLGEVYRATIDGKEDARLHVITFKGHYYESAHGKKKIAKINEELTVLRDLRHANLHVMLASQVIETRLLILTDLMPQLSLHEMLEQCGTFQSDKALLYLRQLAKALQTVHGANLLQRSLRPSQVFLYSTLQPSRATDITAKLAFTSYLQRLIDLCKSNAFSDLPREAVIPDPWLCPGVPEEPLKYDRGRDLFELGVLYAQMVFGLDVCHEHITPHALVTSLDEGDISRSILEGLLLRQERLSLEQLLVKLDTVPTVRRRVAGTTAARSALAVASPSAGRLELPTPIEGQRGFFWQPQTTVPSSRYRLDFEEVEFLGKGGFGSVVKARNRLDGRFYAIKKIHLPPHPEEEQKMLREVTILSRMSHPCIVRYHACWIEVDSGMHYSAPDSTNPAATTIRASRSPQRSVTVTSNNDSSSESDDYFDDDDWDGEPDRTAFDMDMGVAPSDLDDFLSVKGRDLSMASIRFGTASAATVSRPLTPGPSGPSRDSGLATDMADSGEHPRRTLYMQMEFVDSFTLREAIDHGFDDDKEVWRIARQILSAMSHFTALHIIHRDMKPQNIFLDAKGDVRVGDFGLAINQLTSLDDPIRALDSSDSSELTFAVGTGLYIAPEALLRKRLPGTARYTERVDIYSFGIIMMELLFPMSTGHERVQVIRDLRLPEIKLPSNWPFRSDSPETRLVKWCLSHEPERRPSPLELLKSDIFPPQPEEENVQDLVRMYTRQDYPLASTFLHALFDRTPQDLLRRDLTFDFHDDDQSQVALNNPYGTVVNQMLADKFRQRGAISLDGPLLVPQTGDPKLAARALARRRPMQLIDEDGNIVNLPFETSTHFARVVARDTQLARLKRFSMRPLYRQNPSRGQPIALPAASFDIVSTTRTLAAEAEVIQLVDEIFESLPLGSSPEHVLNHGGIWNEVFRDIPADFVEDVSRMFEKYSEKTISWRELTSEIYRRTGLSKAIFEDIRMTFDVRTDVEDLAKHFADSAYERRPLLRDAVRELQEVADLSRRLGVQGRMTVWPLLAPQQGAYFTGVFFSSRDASNSKEVFAFGARYDGLVRKLAKPDTHHVHSSLVSVSISVDRLSHLLGQRIRDAGDALDQWTPRRCDVYIISYASGLLEERLEVVRELWSAGISADLMYDGDWKATSPESMLQTCRREGILLMVIVKARNPHREQLVRVKNVLQRSETEVSLDELASWLEVSLQDSRKATLLHPASATRPTTQKRSTAPRLPRPSEYQVILPQDATRKLKHKSRNTVLDRAYEAIEDTVKASADSPIVAIDLDEPAFSRLASEPSCLASPEAFRARVVDSVPTSRKQYVWEIRDHLLKAKNSPGKAPKSVWLFSLKTSACHLVSLSPG